MQVFTIKNWPIDINHKAYQKVLLKNIKDIHEVVPLPMFNVEGKPVPAAQYKKALRGALIILCFMLVYYSISADSRLQKNRDNYTTDVANIYILKVPTSYSGNITLRTSVKQFIMFDPWASLPTTPTASLDSSATLSSMPSTFQTPKSPSPATQLKKLHIA